MTLDDIEKLYKKYYVPKHVIQHMKKVQELATIIAKKFIEKGIQIDLDTLEKAALVHDVLRVCDFRDFDPEKKEWEELRKKYGKMGHVRAMAKVLRKMGEYKIAKLVLFHEFIAVYNLRTWEEKIMHYADKRVDRDKIVTLEKRFTEGKKRNAREGDNEKFIRKTEAKVFELEKEIEKQIGPTKNYL